MYLALGPALSLTWIWGGTDRPSTSKVQNNVAHLSLKTPGPDHITHHLCTRSALLPNDSHTLCVSSFNTKSYGERLTLKHTSKRHQIFSINFFLQISTQNENSPADLYLHKTLLIIIVYIIYMCVYICTVHSFVQCCIVSTEAVQTIYEDTNQQVSFHFEC